MAPPSWFTLQMSEESTWVLGLGLGFGLGLGLGLRVRVGIRVRVRVRVRIGLGLGLESGLGLELGLGFRLAPLYACERTARGALMAPGEGMLWKGSKVMGWERLGLGLGLGFRV